MSVSRLLRRLEAMGGGKRRLALCAPVSMQAVAEQTARQAGWEVVPAARAEVMLLWDCAWEGEPANSLEWICQLAASDTGSPGGAQNWEPVKSTAFCGFFSVSQVWGRWGERVLAGVNGPPSSRGTGSGWACREWDHRVGRKMALLRIPGMREIYWKRSGGDLDARRSGLSGDLVREAVATFGGVGRVPLAGALLASLLTALAGWWSWPYLTEGGMLAFQMVWGGVALLSVLGCVWTENWAATHFLAEDPREVVLDETAGMAVTLLFLPGELRHASAGVLAASFGMAFAAFRVFDILKIGVRWLERKRWRGSIVWDDLLAGMYAGLVTWMVARLM